MTGGLTLFDVFSPCRFPYTCFSRYQSTVPTECSPGDGTPLIVYKNLVSDIEAVFTVEELEKKSTTTNVEQVHAPYVRKGVDTLV